MPFSFHFRGRHGTGVEQDQQGTNYPFAAPSDDIAHLLADAYLAYEEPADYDPSLTPFMPPFRVAYLFGLGVLSATNPPEFNDPTHAADIVIVDADDRIVFDSTLVSEFRQVDFGVRLRIHEWRGDTDVCRIVEHTEWSPDEYPTPKDFDDHIVPENGVLDERTVQRLPRRVKSLKAVLSTFEKQNVELAAGFNMSLTRGETRTDKDRSLVTPVTLTGTPGGGQGLFPSCDETELFVRTINRQSGNAQGDFKLRASGCYWLRQPVAAVVGSSPPSVSPTAATLQLGNSCGPCCDCDDFVSTVKQINTLSDDFHFLGDTAERTRDTFRENVSRWLDQKACRDNQSLSLAMLSSTCPFMEVAGQFCNHERHCVGPLLLNFFIEIFNPDGTAAVAPPQIQCRSAVIQHSVLPHKGASRQEKYDLLGAFPNVQALWAAVNPGDSVNVRYRLAFSDDTTPFIVKITLTGCVGAGVGFADGAPFCNGKNDVPSVEKIVTLECPDPCLPEESSFSSLSEPSGSSASL